MCEIEVEGEHLLDPFELLRLEHWKFARLEHVMKDPDMFQSMKDEASRAFREIAKKCHPDYDGTRPILGRVMDPHRLLHQLDKAKRILTSKGEFSHFVSQAFAQTEKVRSPVICAPARASRCGCVAGSAPNASLRHAS